MFSVAYLVGAIPFGLLIGKARGVDIRTTGSRNIGATNVMRSVGKGWGIVTLVLDALKGWGAVVVIPVLFRTMGEVSEPPTDVLRITCGCMAILGHSFPVYLRFKGGKGVATSAGMLLGLVPAAFLVGCITFLAVFIPTRYVSLGSIAASIAVPASAIGFYKSDGALIPVTLIVLGVLVIIRHRSNIQRLFNGTEHKIRFRRSTDGQLP